LRPGLTAIYKNNLSKPVTIHPQIGPARWVVNRQYDLICCTRRQHAGSHELVWGIGLLSQQNGRQSAKAQFEKIGHQPCVNLIKKKIVVYGSGGITDIDADDTAVL
jgi:hypothetical protein